MELQKLDFGSTPSAQAPGGAVVAAPPRSVVPSASAAAEPTPHEVQAAVVQANKTVQALAATLEFEVDPDTRTIVIKLVDNSDHTVLRQVPSEEMLSIARSIDRMQGLLLRQKA